jgi:predicted Zn-dependent peptidase
LGVLAPCPVFAQSAPAKYDAGNERYEQARLSNGLSVYLAEDHRVPLVGISISYPVGKTLDPADAPGAAELVASVLPALGTRHLTNGPSDLIGAAGFYPWKVNATARTDETRVDLLVPAAALDLALFLEAERMGFAAEGVNGPLLAWAKQQVTTAFAQRSGGERGAELSQQLLYGPQHPYGSLSAPVSLDKLDVDWLRQRLRRFYGVSGARIGIVGDLDSKRVLGVVQKLFGRLQGLPVPTPVSPSTAVALPKAPGEVRSASVANGFSWAWRTPRFLSEDDISLDVAARYLTHRLSQRLASGDKRARVGVRQMSAASGSMFWLFVPVAEPAARSAVERSVRDEIDGMASGKIDEAELRLAKAQIIADIAGDMDDLQSRARFLISYARLYHKLDGFEPHLASYAQLDAARLSKVVRQYLSPSAAAVNFVYEPKTKQSAVVTPKLEAVLAPPAAVGELSTPDALDWYRPPTAVAVPRFDPPRIFEANVGKSRLLFMPRSGLPTIKLRVSINWQGPVIVPEVRALLLDNLLRAKPAGQPALRDRLADLGATLSVTNDTDAASFVVSALAEHAEQAMVAVRETLEVEHFDKAEFRVTHDDRVKALSEETPDPWLLTGRWLQRLAYPASHRSHVADVAQPARTLMLQRYDQSQLEAFWKAERRAENLTVAIIGPVDEARARALAEAALPRFAAGKSPKAAGFKPPVGLFLVDAPDPAGSSDVRVQFSWPVPGWGTDGHGSSLGLRWLFGEAVPFGLSKFLRDSGVQSAEDWYANMVVDRDESRLAFAVRVPKAQLAGLLKAVPLYVASLQSGAMGWETVQEARREAVQWVTSNFEGANGCLLLASSVADFAAPASSGSDLYLLAQRIDKKSLTKAAAALAPEHARVLVHGPVADVSGLASYGFGEPRRFSAESPGKVQ